MARKQIRKTTVKSRLTKREMFVRETLEKLLEQDFYRRSLLDFLVSRSSKHVLTQLTKFTTELQVELKDRIRLIESLEGEPNDNITEALSSLEGMLSQLEEWRKQCE